MIKIESPEKNLNYIAEAQLGLEEIEKEKLKIYLAKVLYEIDPSDPKRADEKFWKYYSHVQDTWEPPT